MEEPPNAEPAPSSMPSAIVSTAAVAHSRGRTLRPPRPRRVGVMREGVGTARQANRAVVRCQLEGSVGQVGLAGTPAPLLREDRPSLVVAPPAADLQIARREPLAAEPG